MTTNYTQSKAKIELSGADKQALVDLCERALTDSVNAALNVRETDYLQQVNDAVSDAMKARDEADEWKARFQKTHDALGKVAVHVPQDMQQEVALAMAQTLAAPDAQFGYMGKAIQAAVIRYFGTDWQQGQYLRARGWAFVENGVVWKDPLHGGCVDFYTAMRLQQERDLQPFKYMLPKPVGGQ